MIDFKKLEIWLDEHETDKNVKEHCIGFVNKIKTHITDIQIEGEDVFRIYLGEIYLTFEQEEIKTYVEVCDDTYVNFLNDELSMKIMSCIYPIDLDPYYYDSEQDKLVDILPTLPQDIKQNLFDMLMRSNALGNLVYNGGDNIEVEIFNDDFDVILYFNVFNIENLKKQLIYADQLLKIVENICTVKTLTGEDLWKK